ncbi:MAG TPA: hypothetical protein VGM39_08940 [Kofleriaceae bacterium]
MKKMSAESAVPTVRIAVIDNTAPKAKAQRPTLRTALRDLERSLFDAFEQAQINQFDRKR